MPTPPPRTPHPLAQQPDESIEQWVERIRRERGPMPEDMQQRITSILRTSTNHPANRAPTGTGT